MKTTAVTLTVVWLMGTIAVYGQEDSPVPVKPETPPQADAGANLEAKLSDVERRITSVDQAQAELKQKIRELEELRSELDRLQRRINFLERDTATLAEQVRDISDSGGRRLLANLNTDPQFRQELARAANPNAAVKFYNWKGETARMNVNGSWYNLPPGPSTIRVPYGPVAVTHCDKETPRTFTDWTPVDGGFVMAFDVGGSAARTTARR